MRGEGNTSIPSIADDSESYVQLGQFGVLEDTHTHTPHGAVDGELSTLSAPGSSTIGGKDPDDNTGPYYGDAFNLNYVFAEMCDPFRTTSDSNSIEINMERLHFEHLDGTSKMLINERRRNDTLRLQEQCAFKMPSKVISDELIRIFFRQCFPFCLVFDREDFSMKYESGRLSPLILQAIYFLAFIHCEDGLYQTAGFPNRHEASSVFYHRAKALYDANYESDTIANLQAVFILSQWWGTPTEQKYIWHWTGVATNLAQSLELHRSSVRLC